MVSSPIAGVCYEANKLWFGSRSARSSEIFPQVFIEYEDVIGGKGWNVGVTGRYRQCDVRSGSLASVRKALLLNKRKKKCPPQKKTKIKLNQMTVSSFPVLVIQVTASLRVSVLPNCNQNKNGHRHNPLKVLSDDENCSACGSLNGALIHGQSSS